MADYSGLSLEELIDKNNELEGQRATAVSDIKKEQLVIQDEIGKRNLLKRAESFSDEDVKLLAKLRKENPQPEAEAAEEVNEDNG